MNKLSIGVMLCINIIARKVNNFMEVGRHVCKIISCEQTDNSATRGVKDPVDWNDPTEQTKYVFRNTLGQLHTEWFSNYAFKKFQKPSDARANDSDENYLTDKDRKSGKYVQSKYSDYAIDKNTKMRIKIQPSTPEELAEGKVRNNTDIVQEKIFSLFADCGLPAEDENGVISYDINDVQDQEVVVELAKNDRGVMHITRTSMTDETKERVLSEATAE